LRLGDFAKSVKRKRADANANAKQRKYHPNTWSLTGVLRTALGSIGKGTTSREGIDGAHSTLDVVSGVAYAADLSQAAAINQSMDGSLESESHVVGKYYDATPMRLCYRHPEIHHRLMPLARYLVRDETKPDKWKLISYEAYRKRCPHGKLSFGVLEVFAQCPSLDSTEENGTYTFRDIIDRPRILENGKASCIHSANECIQSVKVQSIIFLCSHSKSVFVNDAPDDARSNTRKKLFEAALLRPIANCYVSLLSCKAHGLHRLVSSAMDETALAGDIYAIKFTASRLAMQNSMQLKLYELCQSMSITESPPDPQWDLIHRAIIARTLGRKMLGGIDETGCIDASSGWALFDLPEDEARRVIADQVLYYCNHDWRGIAPPLFVRISSEVSRQYVVILLQR
jgi:hypothetical protein